MAKYCSVSPYLSASTTSSIESFEMHQLSAATETKRKLLQSLAEYIEEQVKARIARSNRKSLDKVDSSTTLGRNRRLKALAAVRPQRSLSSSPHSADTQEAPHAPYRRAPMRLASCPVSP
jgi:hypothetical protein